MNPAVGCHQGRNFGLKSEGTNSEGERSALGSWGERRGEWGGNIPSSSDSGVWESVVSSPSGVRGGAPAENGFIVLYSPQIASADSKFFTFFCPEKWGVLYPSVQKVGVPVPLVRPRKLRLWLPLLYSRPAVTFPAAEHHCPLASSKL